MLPNPDPSDLGLDESESSSVDMDMEDTAYLGSESVSSEYEFKTISSPVKYAAFFLLFVIVPVGAGVYFFGGGKERMKRWKGRKGKGYEKVESRA
ncbi:hypothetical protein JCM24511_08544 [Saitozyma sp. JCM 24511]|nr:hypothetical protein JCM24511_08544 [Saitozyma sp. JCM 24511]